MPFSRRHLLAALVATPLLSRAAAAEDARLPIVFVHGNGDTAELWLVVQWRFLANGYPARLLHAIDMPNPTARTVDDTPQPGHTSAAEARQLLADYVASVRAMHGGAPVVLIGQSRGGNVVRNFVANGGHDATALAILCGAPGHGVIVSDKYLVGNEFNGAFHVLRDLNTLPGEVVAGVPFVTIRSNNNDKYAQPDGRYLGLPGVATGVGFDGPALAGATNIVLDGIDHRETGYGEPAFAAIWRAVTGRDATTVQAAPEVAPVLDGRVTGLLGAVPTNLPVAGAEVTAYPVAAATGERLGDAVHRKVTGADGRWGPFTARADTSYEFVVAAPDYPTLHLYRAPLPHSTDILHIRPQPVTQTEAAAGAVVVMTRPRGYFGLGRDQVTLDGQVPPTLKPGVPTISEARIMTEGAPRTVIGRFNGEQVAARTWPMAERRVSVIELLS